MKKVPAAGCFARYSRAIRHHHILALRQDLEGAGQFGRAGALVMAESLAVSRHQQRGAGSQPESSLRERLGQLRPVMHHIAKSNVTGQVAVETKDREA